MKARFMLALRRMNFACPKTSQSPSCFRYGQDADLAFKL